MERVDQRLVFEQHRTVLEADDTDLADAADPRAGGLHVDHDEVGRCGSGVSDVGRWMGTEAIMPGSRGCGT